MAIERRRTSGTGSSKLAPLGVLLVAVSVAGGCLSPPPSRESAPAPAPPPPAPTAPAEAAPLPAPAREAPGAASTTEGKASAGEAEMQQPSADEGRRDRSPPAPRAASKRARSDAERSASDALGGTGAEPQKPAELRAQLERAERAATPDCPSARQRKKAVCDLAGQICRLTDRDPNVASVAEYCADAKQRCSDAERRTAQSCPD